MFLSYWYIYYDPVKFRECQHIYNIEPSYSLIGYTFYLFNSLCSSVAFYTFFLIACECFL